MNERRRTYSIGTLLFVTFVCGIGCALIQILPGVAPYAMFGSAVMAPVGWGLLIAGVLRRRLMPNHVKTEDATESVGWVMFTLTSFIYLVASMASRD